MKRRALILLIVGIAAAAAVALAVSRRGPPRIPVELAPAVRRPQFRSTVTASGEIVASQYADIGSSAMGKIVDLPVAEGDRVKAGQVLARIDRVQAETEAMSAAEQTRALEADERAARELV
jgi:HlyD family secretion protein